MILRVKKYNNMEGAMATAGIPPGSMAKVGKSAAKTAESTEESDDSAAEFRDFAIFPCPFAVIRKKYAANATGHLGNLLIY